MDFVQKSGVKIPNAVLVSGITKIDEHDEQVVDFLKMYGRVERIISVDDPMSEFHENLIIEFSSGSAVEGLEPQLPYTHRSKGDPSHMYEVKALSSVYASEVGSNVTKTYLAGLRDLAKLSGKDYGGVLREMMSQIGIDVAVMQASSEETSPANVETTIASSPVLDEHLSQTPNSGVTPSNASATDYVPHTSEKKAPPFSMNDVNPPDIQRVVVEHIVRSQDVVSHGQSQVRLRSFSGKTPRPNNETDFDTWRTHIELLLNDPTMSPLQISRKILESLLPPAADVVKGLRSDSLPATYLQLLESTFGNVGDGEELFAQFLNTLQDPGERPSAYLHRLQHALNQVVKRGGVASSEVDRHLLKQFCRGCWDNGLLSALQLEQKKTNPPEFADLMLMIRSEEDRQQAKNSRMRKHISTSKQRVQLQFQGAYGCDLEGKDESSNSAIEKLQKQVASLQSQLTMFMSQKQTRVPSSKVPAGKPQKRVASSDETELSTSNQARSTQSSKPKPWYCFNCGQDGHIAPSCTNSANPDLVVDKRKQLREKQRVWESQRGESPSLNC